MDDLEKRVRGLEKRLGGSHAIVEQRIMRAHAVIVEELEKQLKEEQRRRKEMEERVQLLEHQLIVAQDDFKEERLDRARMVGELENMRSHMASVESSRFENSRNTCAAYDEIPWAEKKKMHEV